MIGILRIALAWSCVLAAMFTHRILFSILSGLDLNDAPEQTRSALANLADYAATPFSIVFLILGVALLLSPYVVSAVVRSGSFSDHHQQSDRAFLVCSVLGCFALGLLVNVFGFQDFKITPDEQAYLNQARIFASGRLCGVAPPLPECFEELGLVHKDGRLFSMFQPAWSLVLAPAVYLGIARCIPPLMGALSLLVIFQLGKRLFGRSTARGAVLIMLFSPFFVFHTATYYSHIFGLLMVSLFALCFHVAMEEERSTFYLLAGLCLGIAFLGRYFDLVFGVPFGCLLLWNLVRSRKGAWKNLTLFVSPILLAGGLALLYQWLLTGDPWLAPYKLYVQQARYIYVLTQLHDPLNIYGFSSAYTPAMGLNRTFSRWMSLNFWVFPLALLFLLPSLVRPKRWEALSLLGFLVVSLTYVPYFPPGGWQYGPRFYFPIFGCLSLLLARGIATYLGFIRGKWGEETAFRTVVGWLFFCVIINICVVFLFSMGLRLVARGGTDMQRVLAANKVREGVVLVTMHPAFFEHDMRGKEVEDSLRKEMPYYLVRNEADYHRPLLYAHYLGDEETRRLMDHFPMRPFYLFRANPFAAAFGIGTGELEPMRRAGQAREPSPGGAHGAVSK